MNCAARVSRPAGGSCRTVARLMFLPPTNSIRGAHNSPAVNSSASAGSPSHRRIMEDPTPRRQSKVLDSARLEHSLSLDLRAIHLRMQLEPSRHNGEAVGAPPLFDHAPSGRPDLGAQPAVSRAVGQPLVSCRWSPVPVPVGHSRGADR